MEQERGGFKVFCRGLAWRRVFGTEKPILAARLGSPFAVQSFQPISRKCSKSSRVYRAGGVAVLISQTTPRSIRTP
jgi:hypothetical protein